MAPPHRDRLTRGAAHEHFRKSGGGRAQNSKFGVAKAMKHGGSASSEMTAPGSRKPVRIRTGHSYHVDFTITLGQRNARFVKRAMTPLNRYFSWANSFAFTPEPGFDAIHSWNAVPLLTNRPFLTTFEDFMPRTPEDRRIGWLERAMRARLMSDQCVGLIAISEYALRQFRQQHQDFTGLSELLAKTELIYPVAAPRRKSPKVHSDRLRLLFVGRDFMRKGGPVLLRAHARLRTQGVPVETTIVSSLHWSPRDYIGPQNKEYVRDALKGVSHEGVIHHHSLPSASVYQLMDAADYLVFPTFHDTFGFVSIGSMAGGTPVIATDTCVLPEVVRPGENGYLLSFENDAKIGKWRWLYKQAHPGYLDAYEDATKCLADALVERLGKAWEDRSDYERLSAGTLEDANGSFTRTRRGRVWKSCTTGSKEFERKRGNQGGRSDEVGAR